MRVAAAAVVLVLAAATVLVVVLVLVDTPISAFLNAPQAQSIEGVSAGQVIYLLYGG